MRQRVFAIVVATAAVAACGSELPPLPQVQTGSFTIGSRPPCAAQLLPARVALDPRAVAELARQRVAFTCGGVDDPLPLDEAVESDAPETVRALLEAGADPNARWTPRGDRFPLEEALEARFFARANTHRGEIVRLLLAHGADPNARWCPFETRGPAEFNLPLCTAREGMTPLIMAALIDDAAVISLLVAARANPALEDWQGANALDYVHSEAAFAALAPAMFPGAASRDADALRYLTRRYESAPFASARPGPWDQTPLANAISGGGSIGLPPPPPPPPGTPQPQARPNGRVALLLRLGADPNQRVTWQHADWTPLALAVVRSNSAAIEALLAAGADPNGRWCVAIRDYRPATWVAEPGCEAATGTTPLMLAESMGRREDAALLRRGGADRLLRDWRGRTSADYAAEASGHRP